jgi:ATP-dependent helicase/DNAse subunit B
VPLTLIAGPANAGKVALLLERYLERLDDDPVLIVPTRSDVDRVERELLTRTGCLFGGTIGTFDDLFERILRDDAGRRPAATEAQRLLLVRAAIASASLNGLGRSARFGGFADALLQAIAELESGLLEPDALDGDLARLYGAYRAQLDDAGLWDRDLVRARAVARLETDLGVWARQPVFAYGFEDLTAAEWRLVETLAGRAEVTVSLPYEAGRPAFEALRGTAEDLAGLARGQIEELPPRYGEIARPALAHLERALFSDTRPEAPPIEGVVRFVEAAGTRGTLEAVAEQVLQLVREGTPPEQIGLVFPSLDRYRAPLESVLGGFGIPYRLEGSLRFSRLPLGAAALSLLRFAWLGGGRHELYAYLRSPFSGVARTNVDFTEGRLRGRGVAHPERVEEETDRLRGATVPALEALRGEPSPVAAARTLLRGMLMAAYGVGVPPATEAARLDLLAYERACRLLDELDACEALGIPVGRDDVASALDRLTIWAAGAESGRVLVADLERARTRRLEVAFVFGLEEGTLPRRGGETPFLDDDERRRLGPRLQRADPVARDRYLFYTACTRASRRLYLVREATDDGSPREPSPFWEEVRGLYAPDEVDRSTLRRPLSALTWPLEDAPTERERLRAVAQLAALDRDDAESVARANGWERRLDRALAAFTRPTKLTHPLVLETLGLKTTFNVTELERFADCSSAWFFERLIDPKTIDAEVDAKLKGSVAHQALYKFFTGLPKELGTDRVRPERVEDGVRFMRRCLDIALEGVRMDMTEMQRRELDQTLWRDLEALVHAEAESEFPLDPFRFEVSFGSERSPQELQRGLDLGDGMHVSGKIDRIDRDPHSARGIVIDYKSGKGAHSAAQIRSEMRLQIPLYMLVLRDLVGLEPMGGLYRPLAGDRKMRGLLRADEAVPGFAKNDYLPEEAFWEQVEGARETARSVALRIRGGDVTHDPKGGECPSWCDLWTMCRVRRA